MVRSNLMYPSFRGILNDIKPYRDTVHVCDP